MSQTIEAIYERGTFRPLRPLALAEGQRVILSFEPVAAEAKQQPADWKSAYAGLSESEIKEIERMSLNSEP